MIYQICNLGGHLIPMGDVPKRASRNSIRRNISSCTAAPASAAARWWIFLRQQGFEKVQNLAGGILAWADRSDTKMPKY